MDSIHRPGGLIITKRAFDICGIPKYAKVLDIGCGGGDTAAFLEKEYDFRVTGIDISREAISQAMAKHPGLNLLEGRGEILDFESLSFDCVLLECTLSLLKNPAASLQEAFRVLKNDGYLIIHDIYLPCPHFVNGVLDLGEIYAALDELSLKVIMFEDRKHDLVSFAASLIFHGGSGGVDDYCGATQGRSQISYFLLVARKTQS